MASFKITKEILREFEVEPRRSERARRPASYFADDNDAQETEGMSGSRRKSTRGGSAGGSKTSGSKQKPVKRRRGLNPFDDPEDEDEVEDSDDDEEDAEDDESDDSDLGNRRKKGKTKMMSSKDKEKAKRKAEKALLIEDWDLLDEEEREYLKEASRTRGNFSAENPDVIEKVLFDEATEDGRYFFVKWKGKSYLHCSRVTYQTVLDEGHGGKKVLENYIAKKDVQSDEAAAETIATELEDDVRERVAEYCIVERVIGARVDEDGNEEYLCKFDGLEYAESTWESLSLIQNEFQDKIDAYLLHCQHPSRKADRKAFLRSEKQFRQFRNQPDWLVRAQREAQENTERVDSKKREAILRTKKRLLDDDDDVDEDRVSENKEETGDESAGKEESDVDAAAMKEESEESTIQMASDEKTSPAALELRDYQLGGVNWLIHSWFCHRNVILADEMGLGKTAQTIAFLSYLIHVRKIQTPYLVVVPLSTLQAWKTEFARWDPSIYVVQYVGTSASREVIRERELKNFNVLLTTYDFVIRDSDFLRSFTWSAVVVDEAHRLKNVESKLYEQMNSFRRDFVLLITGTPLQNSLKELWCLLHFLNNEEFPDCVEFEAQFEDVSSNVDTVRKLHQLLGPRILRRRKKDVAKQLPPKTERILRVPKSPLQDDIYKKVLTHNYRYLYSAQHSSAAPLLNVIMELRKCCNHPFLFPYIQEAYDRGIETLSRASSKMTLLDKLLDRLKEGGHRVLIFSQMVRMLDLLQQYMLLKGHKFQRLDGSTHREDRQRAMQSFNAPNSQDFCFLLSTRAGGLGINLHTADTVIIFDSDWNPQNDLQAEARAHRIGQKKAVSIFRFLTANSVEETVLMRARQKRVLDTLVIRGISDSSLQLSNRNANFTQYSRDELNEILQFGASDLFKKSSENEAEEEAQEALASKAAEFSLDDILADAENSAKKEQEQEEQEESASEDLFSSFTSFTFKPEESDAPASSANGAQSSSDPSEFWKSILPQKEIDKIVAEEAQAEEEKLAAAFQPRQRRAAALSASAISSSSAPTLTSSENSASAKRKVTMRAVATLMKRMGNVPSHITEVLGIPAHRKKEVQALCVKILQICEEEVAKRSAQPDEVEEDAEAEDGENGEKKKKKSKAAGPTVEGVKCADILSRVADVEALDEFLNRYAGAYEKIRVAGAPPIPRTWDVQWTPEADGLLMFACAQHGIGNFDAWKDDPRLQNLLVKVFLEKAPVKKAAKSDAEIPEADQDDVTADDQQVPPGLMRKDQLSRRIDTLLKYLRTPKTAPAAGSKAPPSADQEEKKTQKEAKAKKAKEEKEAKKLTGVNDAKEASSSEKLLSRNWPGLAKKFFETDGVLSHVVKLRTIATMTQQDILLSLLFCGDAIVKILHDVGKTDSNSDRLALFEAFVKESHMNKTAEALDAFYSKRKAIAQQETSGHSGEQNRKRPMSDSDTAAPEAKKPKQEAGPERNREQFSDRSDRLRERDRNQSDRTHSQDRDSNRNRDDRDRQQREERRGPALPSVAAAAAVPVVHRARR
eukprot:ANDGO_06689.mRNA.1 Chromodomain-helicase-DNA-binding protein 1